MATYARQWQVRNNVVNEDANTADMSNEDVREMFAWLHLLFKFVFRITIFVEPQKWPPADRICTFFAPGV